MWVVTGAGGQLGSVIMRALTLRGEAVMGLVSKSGPIPKDGESIPVNLTNVDEVDRVLGELSAKFIIHTAAVTSVADAYFDPQRARDVNVEATARLATIAATNHARFLFTSTDLVFDGTDPPYLEASVPWPTSVYGTTKVEAENRLREIEHAAIVRLPLMIGLPRADRKTTFQSQLEGLRTNTPLKLFEDEFRTPILLEDAAAACIDIARSEFEGVIHAGGPESVSRMEIGKALADALKIESPSIVAARQFDMSFPEPRPADVSLDSRLFEKTFHRPAGRSLTESMKAIVAELD